MMVTATGILMMPGPSLSRLGRHVLGFRVGPRGSEAPAFGLGGQGVRQTPSRFKFRVSSGFHDHE